MWTCSLFALQVVSTSLITKKILIIIETKVKQVTKHPPQKADRVLIIKKCYNYCLISNQIIILSYSNVVKSIVIVLMVTQLLLSQFQLFCQSLPLAENMLHDI